mmetsp:Transcript_33323/g.46618  ORF Transcript_33323/g.46618 Transcript_33323/m.46618 type:complete len:253 (-) Transcript_33323:93-851(-)
MSVKIAFKNFLGLQRENTPEVSSDKEKPKTITDLRSPQLKGADGKFKIELNQNGMMMGFLKKKCPKSYMGKEIWQERYCVYHPSGTRKGIRDSAFSYWRSTNTKRPAAGTLLCKRMEVVAANPSSGKGRFSVLMEGNRLFKFEAENDAIALEWVKAIRRSQIEERRIYEEQIGVRNVEQDGGGLPKSTVSEPAVSALLSDQIKHNKARSISETRPDGKYWKRNSLNRSMSFNKKTLLEEINEVEKRKEEEDS